MTLSPNVLYKHFMFMLEQDCAFFSLLGLSKHKLDRVALLIKDAHTNSYTPFFK